MLVVFSVLTGSHLPYFEQLVGALGVFTAICVPLLVVVLVLVLTERGVVRLADRLWPLLRRLAAPFNQVNWWGKKERPDRPAGWTER